MFLQLVEVLDVILEDITELAIVVLELIGVGIIIVSGIKGLHCYICHNKQTMLTLARGFSIGLEFKLGSEILRTVIVREWSEILTVGGIIILRAALTFLIHWEIKEEKKEEEKKEMQEKARNAE